VTLVVWTNLTVSPDGKPTANSLMLKVLDQVYVDSPLRQAQASSRWSGIRVSWVRRRRFAGVRRVSRT